MQQTFDFLAQSPSFERAHKPRKMPCVPESTWKPKPFPRLADAKIIAIDLETYDPNLMTLGPGWARGDGHIVGIAVGTEDGFRSYYPMRHTVSAHENFAPEHVLAWARDNFAGPQTKIGANILYDVGWLREEGVTVGGAWLDVQFAEALLSESARTSLDALGEKYCGDGKYSGALYRWSAQAYGGKEDGTQRANIYRSPPSLVGPYAQGDVDLPLRVFAKQLPLLKAEKLDHVFALECGLLPLLLEMRFAGVSIDLDRSQRLRDELFLRQRCAQQTLDLLCGVQGVDVNRPESLAHAFDRAGLEYPRTEKSNAPSFTKSFLEGLHNPIATAIKDVRKLEKLRVTFLEGYILNAHKNGKIHGSYHPLRNSRDRDEDGDDGGTRSGRFSSDKPNLTNIPSRDEELAPMVRGLYVPDYGHAQWKKYDYSQIEYRGLIHFARGPGSDEARAHFNAYPETDYHELALDLVAADAGWDISTKALRKHYRKPVKNINFGFIFGMGQKRLAANLHLTDEDAARVFEAYHRAIPFAKPTMKYYSDLAADTGEIRTIIGRKSRFELWEPEQWSQGAIGLPLAKALDVYGDGLRRAHTHKALNRVLQGSAADLMKVAMLKCWRDGIFARTGVPRLTVHDELDFSDPGGVDDAFDEMQHVMETAIDFRIPVRADGDSGPDWGHCSPMQRKTK